jgi:hypothetical protein
VQFLSEDAMRWQPPDDPLVIPELAFRNLRFDGEPGQPADAEELRRQAQALGHFVTEPKMARCFHLVAPAAPLPKGIMQASPALVQSVRVTRRVAPDGRVVFDLVGEVTQSCTVQRGSELFDVHGGCTVILDPEGRVRYSIYKRFDTEQRRERQHAAMKGPLKAFWRKSGRRWVREADMLARLHAGR